MNPSEHIRSSLRDHMNAQIAEAIRDFNPDDALKDIQQTFLSKASEVAKEILGVEDRWGHLELQSSGDIKKYIAPAIKELVNQQLKPLVETEVTKLFGQKQIQDLIVRSIKREVKGCIEDVGGYKSALKDLIEQRVTDEYNSVFNKWVTGQEDDTWLSQPDTSTKP